MLGQTNAVNRDSETVGVEWLSKIERDKILVN